MIPKTFLSSTAEYTHVKLRNKVLFGWVVAKKMGGGGVMKIKHVVNTQLL